VVHPFVLGDLPALRRLSARGISLDSQTYLTQNLHLLRNALLAQAMPDMVPETLMLERRGSAAGFAQLAHRPGEEFSRLRFLAPREIVLDEAGAELIEGLLQTAGRRQAQHVLADAEEKSEEALFLRHGGFSVYARQEIWKGIPPFPSGNPGPAGLLRPLNSANASSALALYCSIVPALVFQVEGFPRRPKGWLIFEDGEVVGFFHQRSGPRGLWMEPIFHPGARNAAEWIALWLSMLPSGLHTPVYVCVRSYQEWMGPILRDRSFTLFSRRAVLFRRVVVPVPMEEGVPHPAVDKTVSQATTYTSLANNTYDSATPNHR
jgi:hypothetical protein